MTRAARLLAVAALVVVLVPLAAFLVREPDVGPVMPSPATMRTLVIAAPTLTWDQVREERPPAMLSLFERSSVASLSVRTIGPRTSAAEGYATIGSGNRAAADELIGGLAFESTETFEGRPAAEVHELRTGVRAASGVVHVAFPEINARNRALRYGARPGTLGQALEKDGLSTAVIGNADVSARPQLKSFHREAALAVMDGRGHVDGGAVASDLLVTDPDAPFGLRLDRERVAAAVAAALEAHDVVILELSDLARADAQALVSLGPQAARLRREALRASDDLVADALEHIDFSRDDVIVVSTASSKSGSERLGVASFAGHPPFFKGLARSGTTRRSGYVTLPDIGPTILSRMAVPVPVEMTGAPVARGASVNRLPLDDLVRADERARFRDRVHGATSVVFILIQVLAYAGALVAVRRPRAGLRRGVAAVALTTLGVPSAAFLLGLFDLGRLSTAAFIVLLYALAALFASVAYLVFRGRAWAPPVALLALLGSILLADVVTGGYLQLDTVFGYSPIVAGRFAGFGNLAFALLASCALVVGCTLGSAAPVERRIRLGLAAVLFVAVVVVDGHPSWGSDVGGVLALVPGFVIALGVLSGARLGWRRLVASSAAAAAVVGLFAALDLARPAADQTHLGRLARRLLEGEGVVTILERKAAANLSLLTSSVWTLIIPAAVAFLGYLIWRPPRPLPELQARTPGLRASLIGGLVVGILGFALNDSGVAVPAMMLAVLLPYVAHLLVVEPH